jgi:hypothetical protein
MIISIKLDWAEDKKVWMMTHVKDDIFVQEFFDCTTMHVVFKGLNRDRSNWYKIHIEPMENKE